MASITGDLELDAFGRRFIEEVLADNFYTARPAFFRAKMNGIRYRGGLNIELPILYADEVNTIAYQQADTIPLDIATVAKTAEYQMKLYTTQVPITRHDILLNSNEDAVLDKVETRRETASMSLNNKIGDDFINSTGVDADFKQIAGLLRIIDSTEPVGGLDPSVAGNEFWKASEDNTNITMTDLTPINKGFGKVTFGTDKPSVAYTTQDNFDVIWGLTQNQQRFVDATMAKAGFDTISINNRPIIVDSGMPNNTFVWVNERWLWLYVHALEDFSMETIPTLPQQRVTIFRISWAGALVTNNRRAHHKFTNIHG